MDKESGELVARAYADGWTGASKDEQLRELLSHCKNMSEEPLPPFDQYNWTPAKAYSDVVERLTEILDGEQ